MKPASNSIESTVYRKPTHTEGYLDYNSTTPFQQNYLLSTPSSTELNKYVLHLNFLQKKCITFTKCYNSTTTCTALSTRQTITENQQKAKYIHRNVHEGARVVIPYIKGLSEQYRQILAKFKVKVLFKGTFKSLLMHQKDSIPDAHKTDITYHWKFPTHNYTD